MKFKEIDSERLINVVLEPTHQFIMMLLKALIILGLGILVFAGAVFILKNYEYGSIWYIIACFLVVIGFFMMMSIFSLITKIMFKKQELKKSKNLLRESLIIQISEDEIVTVIKDNNYIQKIDLIEQIEYPDVQTISIKGKYNNETMTIKISVFFENINLLKEILETFVKMKKAKSYENKVYTELISKGDVALLKEYLNEMIFIVPIKYYFDCPCNSENYWQLEFGSMIEYQIIDDDGKYISVFSDSYKICNQQQLMLYSFEELKQSVMQQYNDIFKDNHLQGIIINPGTDNLKITLRNIK